MLQKNLKTKKEYARTPIFGVTPKRGGYTIIETMIAVSLFLVVIMMGMGALLNANLVHQKSRDMRSILDNLSFIMEDMSRNLRTGESYHCIDSIDPSLTDTAVRNCVTTGKGISFKHSLDGSQWVYFIGSYSFQDGIFKSGDGGNSFYKLTSEEIVINSLSSFSVVGAELGDNKQPFVTIKLVGTITFKGVVTPFSLQTSVSQRVMNI